MREVLSDSRKSPVDNLVDVAIGREFDAMNKSVKARGHGKLAPEGVES
jgi:hypothetical protein